METRCTCRRLRYQHVSVYYGPGVYIKISVESKFFLNNAGEQDVFGQPRARESIAA